MADLSRRRGRSTTDPASYNSSWNLDTSSLPSGYSPLVGDNNPWYQAYQNYQPGLWDRIGDLLHFRTKQDKYREELQLRSLENQNQLLGNAREEDYNSEASQAERLRQAGLNPDLTGVSPSQASEYNEPQVPLDVPSGYGQETVSFLGTIYSGFTTLLGLAQSVQGLKAGSINNDTASVNLLGDYLKLGENFLLSNASEGDFQRDKDGNISNIVIPDVSNLGLSARQQRKFYNVLSRQLGSMNYRNNLYSRYLDLQKSRSGVAELSGSKYFSDDDDILASILGPLGDLARDVTVLHQSYDLLRTGNLKAYEKAREELGLPRSSAELEAIKNALGISSSSNEKAYEDKLSELDVPSEKATLNDKEIKNATTYATQVDQQGLPGQRASTEYASLTENMFSDLFKTDMNSVIREAIGTLSDVANSDDKRTKGWQKGLANFALVIISIASMYLGSGGKFGYSSSTDARGQTSSSISLGF